GIELHLAASRRREEEGRDALLQEFEERAPAEDGHAKPAVDHAVLQAARAAALSDDEGRAFERPRDRLELLGRFLAQGIHVLEDLRDQHGVIALLDQMS